MENTTATPLYETISVIVTTRNNEQTIETCLKSITEQDIASLELIVVDNNSTDKTVEIAKQYTTQVFTQGPERSAQRNYGVSKAGGDCVLIIDSDMILDPTVVSECMTHVVPETEALTIPEQSFGVGFWAQCKALERSFYNGVDWIEAPRFFTKAIYDSVKGYDENIVGGEDWDLRNRVKNVTNIGYINSLIRHDEGRLTLKEIIASRKYYAQGFKKQYDKVKTNTHKDDGQKSGAAQAIAVFGLFLRQPGKLLRKPFIGIGMLFMKATEFGTILIYSKA